MVEENKEELFDIDLEAMDQMAEWMNSKEEQDPPEVPKEEQEEEIEKTNQKQGDESENLEDEEKQEPSSQEINKDSSRLTPYFKLLVEEGLLDSEYENDWDGTTQGLVDLEYKKFNQWKEQYKTEGLDPRVKWLQDNLEEGVPFEELLKIDKEATELEAITEDVLEGNLELQKKVAYNYFKKTTRFSDETINKSIQRLEDANELESEAKLYSRELLSINEQEKAQALENARNERIQAEKQQQEVLSNFKKTLDGVQEVIPGLKVTNILKERVFNTLTTAIDVDEKTGMPINKISKARMENPMDFEIKLAYLFELTNGFTDWSPLGATGKKQAYKNFEEAAKNIDYKETKTTQTYKDNTDFLKDIDELYNRGIIR